MIYIVIPTTPERHTNADRLLASIREHTTDVPHCVVLYENNDGGWAKAVQKATAGLDGYVQLLGDDVVVQAGWLKALTERFFERFPDGDGVAQPFDEIHNGRLGPHPFCHTDTLRKYGHWGYTHNFFDTEMTARAKADGKFLYVPEARIEHRHWITGKAEVDDTYRRNNAHYSADEALFVARRENGFQ